MPIRDEVLRLTDRFYAASDPDAIDRQSQLQHCLIIVLAVHVTVLIAFWKGWEVEKAHPRLVRDVDVTFEFNIAPPEPVPVVLDVPRPIAVISDPGSSPPLASAESAKIIEPIKHIPLKPPPKEQEKPSYHTPVPGPISLVPTTGRIPPLEFPTKPNDEQGNVRHEGGPAGTDVDGKGKGNGTDNGEGGGNTPKPPITVKIGDKEMGNIGPYRNALLKKIAENWHPQNVNRRALIDLTVGPQGELLESKIVESSGSRRFDKQVQELVNTTDYEPLPDWFKGKFLVFRIEMTRVVASLGTKGG